MTTVKAFNENGTEEGRGSVVQESVQAMVLVKPRNGDPFWWPKGLTEEFTAPKYSVENGFLFINGEQVPYYPTPNCHAYYPAGAPSILVWHYTATRDMQTVINRFMNPNERASSALAIDTDGSIVQFAPFNKPTWHAGDSLWGGRFDVNRDSMGLEIINFGWLKKINGVWQRDGVMFDACDVLELPHPLSGQVLGWPIFPDVQLDTVLELSTFLYGEYQLTDVVGHENVTADILYGRFIRDGGKVDPGAGFPMEYFREQICGVGGEYIIGWGGGKGLKPFYGAPSLIGWSWTRFGMHVEILETKRRESRVRILEGNTKGKEGWIETRYLRRMG